MLQSFLAWYGFNGLLLRHHYNNLFKLNKNLKSKDKGIIFYE